MILCRDFQPCGKVIPAGTMESFLAALRLLIITLTAPRHFRQYLRVLWFHGTRWACRPISDSSQALWETTMLIIWEMLSNLCRPPRLLCRMVDRQESCSAPSSLCFSVPCLFPAEKITPELRAALQVGTGEMVAKIRRPGMCLRPNHSGTFIRNRRRRDQGQRHGLHVVGYRGPNRHHALWFLPGPCFCCAAVARRDIDLAPSPDHP